MYKTSTLLAAAALALTCCAPAYANTVSPTITYDVLSGAQSYGGAVRGNDPTQVFFAPAGSTAIFGQGGAFNDNDYVVSNDNATIRMNLGATASSLTFDIQDAADQRNSFFRVNGVDVTTTGKNGNVVSFAFQNIDSVLFETKARDGFAQGNIKVVYDTPAPVPVPAAGLMLVAGLGGLAFFRRKRKA